jgi:hypothetical protein
VSFATIRVTVASDDSLSRDVDFVFFGAVTTLAGVAFFAGVFCFFGSEAIT